MENLPGSLDQSKAKKFQYEKLEMLENINHDQDNNLNSPKR